MIRKRVSVVLPPATLLGSGWSEVIERPVLAFASTALEKVPKSIIRDVELLESSPYCRLATLDETCDLVGDSIMRNPSMEGIIREIGVSSCVALSKEAGRVLPSTKNVSPTDPLVKQYFFNAR